MTARHGVGSIDACPHGARRPTCQRCASAGERQKISLTLLVRREVTIECSGVTCSPCAQLHIEFARGPKDPGKAGCGLFGKPLEWSRTVGEIERLPECCALDGLPKGTEVRR